MVRRLRMLCLCLLAVVPATMAASLTTAVDRDRVRAGESFVVTFIYEGEDVHPDFTAFERDFDILHQGQSRNVRIAGGDVRVETTWNLVLSSGKEGELSLPRIRFGDQLSQAHTVTVAAPPAGAGDAAGDQGGDDLFVEVEVDKETPYVQEQVLYTARVFRAVAIENASLAKPAVSGGDAVIERLGDDRRYQATRDGRRYAVTERRFVLFPQTSGALTIEPVRLDAEVPIPAAGNTTSFWRRAPTRAARADSAPVVLAVRAPPDNAPDPWLPARRVTLEEDWPERNGIRVGTPITRRLILSADGLMDSQLPGIPVPLPEGVKSYPERPTRQTRSSGDGVSGLLEQTIAIVPGEAGTLTLPALELDWWNTGTDRRETLRLPPRVLEVEPGPAPAGSGPAGEPGPDRTGQPSRAPWWLSLGLALAWLATGALWWRDRRRVAVFRAAAAGQAGAASRRAAEARLRAACRAGDPRAARDALLAWGRACWPGRPPRSLGMLGRMTDDAVAVEIAALQRALYAPDAAAWQGDGLQRALTAFEPDPRPAGRPSAVLRPLFQR